MKRKLILILFLFFVFQSLAFANYLPYYSSSISNWGYGVILTPREFSLYDRPDKASKKNLTIKWTYDGKIYCNSKECVSNPFLAFVPVNNYALLPVIDETDGWVKVYSNNLNNKNLWIELDNSTKFYTWGQFILNYGKRHGLYVLKDVKKEDRKLYASSESGAQVVDVFEISKYISPWFVSGNFVMVKLIHWDNSKKAGFLRWRDSDGKLWAFVDLKK